MIPIFASGRGLACLVLGAAALLACGSSADGSGGGGGPGGADEGGGGADPGTGGGCVDSSDCDAGSYCHLGGYGCNDDFPSECRPRPDAETCEPNGGSVCGCDGNLYESECHANASGVYAGLYANSCEAPPDTFECGYTFCLSGVEACMETFEVSFSCREVPEDCDPGAGGGGGADPGCECFAELDCSCSSGGNGDIHLTCGDP